MGQKVTIMTIAKAAGVSHTTVSRALNDSPLVQDATKQRIKEIAASLGYHPNINAKALVERKSYIVGAYFTDLDNGTTPAFMFNAINQARQSIPTEYSVAVNSFANIKPTVPSLAAPRCDGALVISQASSDDPYIQKLSQSGLPIVVVNRKANLPGVFNVVSDDQKGISTAVDFAISQGHRHFGLINGKSGFDSSKKRRLGTINSLQRQGLSLLSGCDQPGQYTFGSGYMAMKRILEAPVLPTCVVAANDVMAIGAMRACADAGLNVPGQISFIGYDDTAAANYCLPRLTTVHKPTREMIQVGMQWLIQEIGQHQLAHSRLKVIAPRLVVRDSVVKLN